MRKTNAGEAVDSHVGIGEFQDALGEENEADGKANEKEAGGASRGLGEEAEE